MRSFCLAVLVASTGVALLAADVKVWQGTLALPVHEEGLPDVNPPFDSFAPPGKYNYPYTLRTSLTGKRVDKQLRALYLENEYLRCSVLPDIGGHLYSCTDKLSGTEMFYANPSIKKQLIGYRGAWAAFGIEFNFPVSHNWMSMSPVDFAMRANPDGSASVFVSNIDRPYGMQWLVELVLRPGSTVLEQHVTLYNRSDLRRRYYYWNNAGIEVTDDSRIYYPMRFAASHGFTYVDSWPIDHTGKDLSVVRNQTDGPVSMFVHGSREPFMGVWHPHNKTGIAHYADYADLPAKKIWSWGVDADGLDWRRALSDNNSGYVEVQAGLFRNQETYAFLPPQAALHFSEYWIPVRAIGGISRANRDAAVYLSREEGRLSARLNVNRDLKAATVRLRAGTHILAERNADLTPRQMFTIEAAAPAGVKATVEVLQSNKVLLAHTEETYDWTPTEEIKPGSQSAVDRSKDALERGSDQEVNGALLEAAATYANALRGDADNFELNKAAGRLAVALKNYPQAVEHLLRAQRRSSSDAEVFYHLGLAYWSLGDIEKARANWEGAQRQPYFRPQARLQLAKIAGKKGDYAAALEFVNAALNEQPGMVRAQGLKIALLRTLGRADEARRLLDHSLATDPTNSLLRLESVKLNRPDTGLWNHLSADPERVLEIAVDYLNLGLYRDALDVLSREYPAVGEDEQEPGTSRPQHYALAAYYRAYCRQQLHESPGADYASAAAMPTRYVFPHRVEDFTVLTAAVSARPNDANAHFLLGSLYMSGGQADRAIAEWNTARALNPKIPVLHRNLGRTLLVVKHDDSGALEAFHQGLSVDPSNVELYTGISQAQALLKRPPQERVEALSKYPDQKAMPTSLVFDLALSLAESGQFEKAKALFANRYFEREEGGTNVRQVYLEIRLLEALATPTDAILAALEKPVPGLDFTKDGLDSFLASPRFEYYAGLVKEKHGDHAAAQAYWLKAAGKGDVFSLLSSRSLGDSSWRSRAEAQLARRTSDTGRGAAYQRGMLLRMLGRNDEAAQSFAAALRLPDQRLSHYFARRALMATDGVPAQ